MEMNAQRSTFNVQRLSGERKRLLAALLLAPLLSFAAEKPNVVILFIDDMGYGDIGPFGATRQKTPNLDRMAQEGMKFTSVYAAPVCAPGRTGFRRRRSARSRGRSS